MKKSISLSLIFLILFTFAACGNQTTTENPDVMSGQTESNVAETEQPQEETLSFDTTWTGEDYVIPIPAPPFKQFSISTNHYTDCLQYYISSTEKDEIKAFTEDDIQQYCILLKDSGFTKIKTELEFNADNCVFVAATEDESIQVTVDCYMDLGNIVIFVKQNITQE